MAQIYHSIWLLSPLWQGYTPWGAKVECRVIYIIRWQVMLEICMESDGHAIQSIQITGGQNGIKVERCPVRGKGRVRWTWSYERVGWMKIGWEVNKFISPKLRTSRLPVSSFKNAIVQETSILNDYNYKGIFWCSQNLQKLKYSLPKPLLACLPSFPKL